MSVESDAQCFLLHSRMDRESDVGSSETGSGRDTPHSVDQESQRPYTPGTMPAYQYSKVSNLETFLKYLRLLNHL